MYHTECQTELVLHGFHLIAIDVTTSICKALENERVMIVELRIYVCYTYNIDVL